MFTGIVEALAVVTDLKKEGGNLHITLRCPFTGELKVDQSIAHNGVCLTVVDSEPGEFSVAIIPYTYEHTNFHTFVPGTKVNLEFDVIGKYAARLLGK